MDRGRGVAAARRQRIAGKRGYGPVMANFFSEDLRGFQLERVDLSDAQLRAVDLSGARFRGVDLSGVVMHGVELVNADIHGEVVNVTVNGVDIGPLIEAELKPAVSGPGQDAPSRPGRVPRGMGHPGAVVGPDPRPRPPPGLLHESAGDEWSFIETVRRGPPRWPTGRRPPKRARACCRSRRTPVVYWRPGTPPTRPGAGVRPAGSTRRSAHAEVCHLLPRPRVGSAACHGWPVKTWSPTSSTGGRLIHARWALSATPNSAFMLWASKSHSTRLSATSAGYGQPGHRRGGWRDDGGMIGCSTRTGSG